MGTGGTSLHEVDVGGHTDEITLEWRPTGEGRERARWSATWARKVLCQGDSGRKGSRV